MPARASAEAGVVYLNVYAATKHSTLTALKSSGEDDRTLAALARHRETKSVQAYASVTTTTTRGVVTRLDQSRRIDS